MAKMVKCPECGEEFKKPLLAEKRHGIGYTIYSFGDLTCPQCRYKGPTSTFVEIEKSEKQ
jgi:ssDNA-binding Zn-finger/Zn-ribbon topoisomerase 1